MKYTLQITKTNNYKIKKLTPQKVTNQTNNSKFYDIHL